MCPAHGREIIAILGQISDRMDILLAILAVLCAIVGLLGCFVPVLPGPPLSLLGLFLIHWTGYVQFSSRMLIVWSVVTLAVTLADYYLPAWMTRRFGGSRAATIGATVGLLVGMFLFPPLGIVVGPFVGAFVGELIHDRTDNARALRVALGSFVAFVLGTGLKLVASGMMAYYVVRALI